MLRDDLTYKQRAAGMTDAEFGALLGLRAGTWQAIRLGYRRLNRRTALRVQIVFPDLADRARDYLLNWTPLPQTHAEARNGQDARSRSPNKAEPKRALERAG